MGNGQPRYYSNNEAIEIIGGDTWDRLRKQLERSRGKGVDYAIFNRILHTR